MAEEKETGARPPDRPLSRFGLVVIGLTVAIDQATKLIAERTLPLEQAYDLLPILSLYRVYNTGIAFSLFAGLGDLPLIALTLGVTVAVLIFWQRTDEGGRLAATGYALIVGGALGNLTDRFAHGHVIDFLLLHIGGRSLFVFNLADTALTIGPALLILVFLFGGDRAPRGKA